MIQVFEAIFSIHFILFSLTISTIVEIFRRIVQFFILDNPRFKPTRTSIFWRNVILPSTPVMVGLLICLFVKDIPYPDFLTGKSSQLMFGITSGLVSGLVYKVIKARFKNMIKNQNSNTDSE